LRVARTRRIAALILLVFPVALFIVWTDWVPGAQTQKHNVATLIQLPLSFEANRGQADADAKFAVRGTGYAVALTERGEPVLALHGQPRPPVVSDAVLRQGNLLRLEFAKNNPAPRVQGEQPLLVHSNYVIGSDPSLWLIGVPHYASVRYREVYPAVDVLYYAKDQQLEYDFIVRRWLIQTQSE
jgi:hypothetical protein